MEGFTESTKIINDIEFPILIDSDNKTWYPFSYFIKKVLKRTHSARDYFDTEIENHMKSIPYKFKMQKNNVALRTWFIDEDALKYILKNMTVKKGKETIMKEKELALDGACIYFGIKNKSERKTKFAKMEPTYSDYNEWEKIFLKADKDISDNTEWKRCYKCEKYFPNNKKYFDVYKNRYQETLTKGQCLVCKDKCNLQTDNNDLRTLYKNNELNMAKNLIKGNHYNVFLRFFLNEKKFTLEIFDNPSFISDCILKLKDYSLFNMNNYNLHYISSKINVPVNKLRSMTINYINIGFMETLKKHKTNDKSNIISIKWLEETIKRNFKRTLSSVMLDCFDCDPIIGIITNKGLVIIARKECEIRYAQVFKYTNVKKDMINIINRIRRQGGTKV